MQHGPGFDRCRSDVIAHDLVRTPRIDLVLGAVVEEPAAGWSGAEDTECVLVEDAAVGSDQPQAAGVVAQHVDHRCDCMADRVVPRTASERQPPVYGQLAIRGDVQLAQRQLHRRREARVEVQVGD